MKRFDVILLVTTLVLTLFGLLMLYNASSYIAYRDFGDKYRYFKDQTMWVILGVGTLGFFTLFDYRKLYNLALPILLMSITLLLLVFIPGIGIEVLGARRWINMGFFTVQPAEFAKLALAIYLAAWFSKKEKGRFLAFSLLIGLMLFLVMLEPDMGTSGVILAETMIIFFLSGGSLAYFAAMIPAVLVMGFVLIKIAPYRAQRLTTFLNPEQSIETTSYHVRQILIALGSGGLTGVGLGNSIQKYAYLPENATDSIFAIIAEEIGFIGSVIFIGLFLVIIWRGFIIAMDAKDTFGKLLAGGITSYLGIQTFINLAAQSVLIPLTGIPLPFISYGGSAMLVAMASVGILLNISRHRS